MAEVAVFGGVEVEGASHTPWRCDVYSAQTQILRKSWADQAF
jgi:hypothetical protein